jgi:glycosyltransferase involved in cell wall biosynthesis
MKVALVHDYLNQMGGAERVLLALHDLYPDAPVYTSFYDPQRVDPSFRWIEIRTSWMQRLPLVSRHHQPFLPLYPLAFERLDLGEYDLVLSSSSAFAKGINVRADALHICYCHTPMRWAWNSQDYLNSERMGPLAHLLLPSLIRRLRQWDWATAQRVDSFIANSPAVAQRIRDCYQREAAIIPPPVDTSRYYLSEVQEPFFLIVSRLVPYKRLDIAIQACNRLQLPLKIIGTGRDQPRLERLAGPTVELLGWLPDEQVRLALSRCQALISTGEEDFGLAMLEAQASGRPVIAYGAGGALSSIIEGSTGSFFYQQTPEALMDVLRCFQADQFDPQVIRRHAEAFDTARFRQRITQHISDQLAQNDVLHSTTLAH